MSATRRLSKRLEAIEQREFTSKAFPSPHRSLPNQQRTNEQRVDAILALQKAALTNPEAKALLDQVLAILKYDLV